MRPIVTVLIRLLALKVALDGVSYAFSLFGEFRWISLGAVIIFMFLASGIWHISSYLAGFVAGDTTAPGSIALTRRECYSVAFVALGAYLIATSLGATLNWLHFTLLQSSGNNALTASDRANFYRLFEPLSKLALGIVGVWRGHSLAARLVQYEEKYPNRDVR